MTRYPEYPPPDERLQGVLARLYERAVQRAQEAEALVLLLAEEPKQEAHEQQGEATEHEETKKEPGDQPGSENARFRHDRQTTTPAPY